VRVLVTAVVASRSALRAVVIRLRPGTRPSRRRASHPTWRAVARRSRSSCRRRPCASTGRSRSRPTAAGA